MNFISIIEKKKHNIELSKEEIFYLVNNFINDNIKDYQMSSFLMAVWFNSLTDNELFHLTTAMIESGHKYDLKKIDITCIDKHSTGGIGDKTSLVFGPILAYLGVGVGKISGRGLGQTGGTIDKLESCSGWSGEMTNDQFVDNLKKNSFVLMSQSDEAVKADKMLYALRDVTGTVDSNVLIASSIMSKKLIIPSDCIILDVKVGNGAFVKNVEDAKELSKKMIAIAKQYNKHIGILLSDMNKPLGRAIGNAIEVKEAYDTLNGNGPNDLIELVSFACASALILTNKRNNFDNTINEIKDILISKKAAIYLEKMIKSQHGNFDLIKNYNKNFNTKYSFKIKAKEEGYISFNSSYDLGILSMNLGAGRVKKNDKIDFAAGIYLNKQSGESVKKGETIMTLYTNKNDVEYLIDDAQKNIKYDKKCENKPIILDYLTT